MLWNQLSYDEQLEVLDLIQGLLMRQRDKQVRLALSAALNELEVWSNSPVEDKFIEEGIDIDFDD